MKHLSCTFGSKYAQIWISRPQLPIFRHTIVPSTWKTIGTSFDHPWNDHLCCHDHSKLKNEPGNEFLGPKNSYIHVSHVYIQATNSFAIFRQFRPTVRCVQWAIIFALYSIKCCLKVLLQKIIDRYFFIGKERLVQKRTNHSFLNETFISFLKKWFGHPPSPTVAHITHPPFSISQHPPLHPNHLKENELFFWHTFINSLKKDK